MIGIVADDTTGANDIGIMFSKNNYLTKIVTFEEGMELLSDADVVIIDTDSRLDIPEVAYRKVFAAAKQLQAAGCTLFHKKTCSVFRGNVGREFDAMLDALGEAFMIVSLAFPKNGRQTIHGIHTVHGKLLECSEFASDPVHPMRRSDLLKILQDQTQRKVGLVDITLVRQGREKLRIALKEEQGLCSYCIVDAENQEDLTVLASAVQGFAVLGGSSALAEELPKFWPAKQPCDVLKGLNFKDHNGVLVVSGSLMPQTAAQTAFLQSAGVPVITLDTREIFDEILAKQKAKKLAEQSAGLLAAGTDVLLMADNHVEVVKETKALGRKLGIEEITVSKLVSAVLADITDAIVAETGLKRLVIAGGDTSGTICRKLGIKGNFVVKEIETGLPSGLALGRKMLIVLKSGSFGKPEFLQKAVDHLKTLP